MKTYLTISAIFVACSSFSQVKNRNAEQPIAIQTQSESAPQKIEKAENLQNSSIRETEYKDFQFILNSDGLKPLITPEILDFVQSNRSETEDKTLDFSDNIKVFIPSEQTLKSSNYQTLPLYKVED